MKGVNKKELESGRPNIDVLEGISYCLDALYDETAKTIDDFAVKNLKFEEIIGVLLLAKDKIKTSYDN